jgi:hypothetical protein
MRCEDEARRPGGFDPSYRSKLPFKGYVDVPWEIQAMSQPFRIGKGDVTAFANFSEPAFAGFDDANPLLKALYGVLSPFGLRLVDLKFEDADGNIGEEHLLCLLPHLSISIRVLADRAEVICFDTLSSNLEDFVNVTRSTFETVGKIIGNNPYKSYALLANFHGTVEGTPTSEYLAKITGASPAKLGPLVGSGSVFYYGAEADRLSALLTVDLSGVRAGDVYVRPYAVWDATKVKLADLQAIGEKFLQVAFAGIGLDWPVLPPK